MFKIERGLFVSYVTIRRYLQELEGLEWNVSTVITTWFLSLCPRWLLWSQQPLQGEAGRGGRGVAECLSFKGKT